MKKPKLSPVMVMHYVSFCWRGVLFLVLLLLWLYNTIYGGQDILYRFQEHHVLMALLWILFALEMAFRFFPSRIRSPGCQKQFAVNYIKTGNTDIEIQDNHATILVLLLWIVFNAGFGALHMIGVLNGDFMLFSMRHDLHSVLLSVSDLVFQEPLLRDLPDLQLGLCHDLHAAVLRAGPLHVEPSGNGDPASGALGDQLLSASGAILREDERISVLRELHGEAVPT